MLASFTFTFAAGPAGSAGVSVIGLPKPAVTGGGELMKLLSERRTTRDFVKIELSPRQISEILYSAFGINRADGRRTVPTALNKQDLSVYVLFSSGVYRYEAVKNNLISVSDGDFRKYSAGRTGLGESGAMTLVIVSDTSKWKNGDLKYPSVHAGSAIQNVYLYCASEGLGTVVCASYDEAALTKALKLNDNERIILTQIIGGMKK